MVKTTPVFENDSSILCIESQTWRFGKCVCEKSIIRLEYGLLKIKRPYVMFLMMLSCNQNQQRHGKSVVLLVDSGRMYKDGYNSFIRLGQKKVKLCVKKVK